MKKLVSRICLVLVVVALIAAVAACAAPTPTPTPTPTSTPTPTPTPLPTATPTPNPHFDKDYVLMSRPDAFSPDSKMEVKMDGTFTIDLAGDFPDVTGSTYTINSDGKTLDVAPKMYDYTFELKDGEMVVTLVAGGGAVKIKFYSNYDKFQGTP